MGSRKGGGLIAAPGCCSLGMFEVSADLKHLPAPRMSCGLAVARVVRPKSATGVAHSLTTVVYAEELESAWLEVRS